MIRIQFLKTSYCGNITNGLFLKAFCAYLISTSTPITDRTIPHQKPLPNDLAKNLSGGTFKSAACQRTFPFSPSHCGSPTTRGLDIGASEYVHEQLLEQRKLGTAILLISEDLDEIMALADRIAVIYEGNHGCFAQAYATKEDLGLLMAGVHPGETIQN